MMKSKQMAYSIIFHYAKYDKLDKQYTLNRENIPEHDIQLLTALILQEERTIANESTGCDNDEYYNSMLPSLIHLLKSPCNETREIDFLDSWKSGVMKYVDKYIDQLLNEQLEVYNSVQQSA